MNCERIREQIPEALAGRLAKAAREALVEHLEGCGACRTEVAELNAVWRGLEAVKSDMDAAPESAPPPARPIAPARAAIAQARARTARSWAIVARERATVAYGTVTYAIGAGMKQSAKSRRATQARARRLPSSGSLSS